MADPDDDIRTEKLGGFALSALVVYGVLLAATIPVLLRRRHMQPLKFRDPSLLISTIAVTYLATGCSVLIMFITFPYCILQVLNQTPFVFMISLIMARFWKLFLASRLTCARLCRDGHDWILHYPWMASTRNIWRGVLALGTVLALVQLAVAMPADACIWSDRYWASSSVVLTLYWVTMAVMTWMLRNVQDGLFVVTELRLLGLVVLLTNALAIVLFQPDLGLGAGIGPGFIVVSSLLQMVIQAWYPLWKSYQMAPAHPRLLPSLTQQPTETATTPAHSLRQSLAALTPASSFLDLLRHPDGFEAMKEFLKLEFSVENILCWQQLFAQKRERRPELVQAHFAAIYETFVRAGSCNEVNVSSQLKDCFDDVIAGKQVDIDAILQRESTAAIREQKGHVSPDPGTEIRIRLMRRLYHEIVTLMQHDSYQRFKQSKRYRDLVQRDDQETKGRRARHDLNEVVSG